MTRRDFGRCCLVLALLDASLAPPAFALGTAFTYQGQLQQGGAPANGPCDFQFGLWDALGSGAPPTGGTQIGTTQTKSAVNVSNGVFTLPLDFGAAAFSSASDRWLHIAVRCPAGSGSYQALAPRQPLTPVPFALFANGVADGSVSSAKLASGAVTAAQIADGTIATNDLANGAVSTAKIGDGQVTGAKLVAPLRLTSSVANTLIGAFDGTSTGANGVGVSGTAHTGFDSAGVLGKSDDGDGVRGGSLNGAGVYGESLSAPGVWGESADDGVFGVSTGSGAGVSGVAMGGAGVKGESINGTGVLGEGQTSGVRGFSATGDGVLGISVRLQGYGVHGIANVNNGGAPARGVFGESDAGVGVYGESDEHVGVAGIGRFGVVGLSGADDGVGVGGQTLSENVNSIGVKGNATKGIGVRGESVSGFAGVFVGPVQVTSNLLVTGAVVAGVKQFKIDHPLDPANKYLMHAAVESSEMKNLYDGVVVLDANGEARVDLPQWFEALNRDFRYQLTCIGGVAPVYVAEEVNEAHFRIAGGTAGLKVSWQVTGIRKDAFAVAHPLAVEADKTAEERGRYLSPMEMGVPAALSVDRTQGGAALQ